jgi:adenosylcobinamide kinase/adenosylcobinamide-phosphate guanylyltransferase
VERSCPGRRLGNNARRFDEPTASVGLRLWFCADRNSYRLDGAHRLCRPYRSSRDAAVGRGRPSHPDTNVISYRCRVSWSFGCSLENGSCAGRSPRWRDHGVCGRPLLYLDDAKEKREIAFVILIGGGSRSGKSKEALKRLRAAGARLGFIATAQAWDDEMRERINVHRVERGSEVVTWEEPLRVADRLRSEGESYDGIVVDCLTLWLTNLVLQDQGRDIGGETEDLLDAAASTRSQIILVTNEVGCGIIPENALARRFRDEAGRLNQRAAERASEVYWMVFGIGLRIK